MLENTTQHIACDFDVSQEVWNVPSRVYSIASCGWAFMHHCKYRRGLCASQLQYCYELRLFQISQAFTHHPRVVKSPIVDSEGARNIQASWKPVGNEPPNS